MAKIQIHKPKIQIPKNIKNIKSYEIKKRVSYVYNKK
mgnify:CR=1 FL=1